MNYNSVELFSGAGGLALGLAAADFHHEVLVEWNQHACNTLRFNKEVGLHPVNTWDIVEGDARNFDFTSISKPIDLIAGGPPCQPFSLGGKHKGYEDNRDMFPIAVKAVRELCPKVFVFENVKGLLRSSFTNYLKYITLQLNYPNQIKYEQEVWEDHLSRLERYHTAGNNPADGYKTVIRLLNAADYGVPQKRERIFIVGFRNDLKTEWTFPKPTHSEDALIWAKWVTGDYWDEHKVSKKDRPVLTATEQKRVEKLYQKYGMFGPTALRWRTVRDAISNLPKDIKNHEHRAGAQIYPGHTGSELDEPAKTLKAGDHGVPGGENMVRYYDNSVRYFSVRESARLQTFPDDFFISGSWTEGMRQIGNAVPVKLAEVVGKSIRVQLERAFLETSYKGYVVG
ncbi:MAG: DNA cytosine methyltransferase [Runella zeae]